jgi:hypothetical protein
MRRPLPRKHPPRYNEAIQPSNRGGLTMTRRAGGRMVRREGSPPKDDREPINGLSDWPRSPKGRTYQ